jgi:hypothetical protein
LRKGREGNMSGSLIFYEGGREGKGREHEWLIDIL